MPKEIYLGNGVYVDKSEVVDSIGRVNIKKIEAEKEFLKFKVKFINKDGKYVVDINRMIEMYGKEKTKRYLECFAYVIGVFLLDGSVGRHMVLIASKWYESLDMCRKYLIELGMDERHIKLYEKGSNKLARVTNVLVVNSVKLVTVLKNFDYIEFMRGVMKSGLEKGDICDIFGELLGGMFDAGGHICKRGKVIRFWCGNERELLPVAVLLKVFGIDISVRRHGNGYKISVRKYCNEKLIKILRTKVPEKEKMLEFVSAFSKNARKRNMFGVKDENDLSSEFDGIVNMIGRIDCE